MSPQADRVRKPFNLRGEILRKGTHILALVVPVMFIHLPKRTSLWLVTLGALVAMVQDVLRIHSRRFRRALYRFWGSIYRRWEIKRLSGASYILSAAALALVLFEKCVAALVMVYIIVGDTAAVFVGKLLGKHTIYCRRNADGTVRCKTVEGTAAFLVSAALAGLFIPNVPIGWKFAGAALATTVEVSSYIVDDNLTVPLVVGVVLQLAIFGEITPSL